MSADEHPVEPSSPAREVQQRRSDSETLVRGAFDRVAIGMALVSPEDHAFLRVNPALGEMLGYEVDDLVGRSFVDVTHPDDVERSRALADELARGIIDTGRIEKRFLRRDGTTIWVDLSVSVLLDPDHQMPCHIVQVLDITRQREVEDALRESERSASVARDEALEASRMKSQFMANMSHEIRTPMNGVLGMLDLLMQTPLATDQEHLAHTARSSAESLLTIIDDILDFSKIEAGKLEIEAVPVDLERLVEETVALLWRLARDKGLRLIVRMDGRLPQTICGDPTRLRQIMLNLLGNALKFTAAGEVVLTVEPSEEHPDLVRFAVADDGIGVASDVLPQLFKPFAQGDSSTTRRFGGTGLGLSISRQLAVLMGGEVGASSEPGIGSVFWFTARLPSLDDASARASLALDGRRVLVVSESAKQARALAYGLGVSGAEVQEAHDGDAACAACADGPRRFDVAVVDELASGYDAVALAARLRAAAPVGLRTVLLGGPPMRLADLRAVIVPPAAAPDAATPGGPAPSWGQPGTASPGEGRLVLLAEDNEINQQVATLCLRALGYDVDLAPDGREAVRLARERSYDAILMDCQMPELDGYAATAAIRAGAAGGAWTPIIAMTASSMESDRRRCLMAGMDDFLPKPVRPGQLAEVLEHWIARS